MKKIQNSCIFERKTFEMNHEEGCVSFGYSHISYMYIHDNFFFSPLSYVTFPKHGPNIYSGLHSSHTVTCTALGIAMSQYINVYLLGKYP